MLFLALGAMPAHADTFDCAHPSSPLGGLVCGDPLLRTADSEESAVYDAALSASLDRSSLRAEEGAWFDREILPYNWFAQQHAPIDKAKIAEAYRERGDALQQETQAWRKLRRPISGAALANSCLALPAYHPGEECDVDAFKPVEGDASLRYQRQNYPKHAAYGAVVVLASTPSEADEWQPVVAVFSDTAYFTAPRLIERPDGRLLLIAGTGGGTAQNNASALYRFERGTLQEIDDRTWLDSLHAKLPRGLNADHDIFPDYAKMVAETELSRPGDSNCCPTGGRVRLDLAIENDAIVLKNVSPETAPAASGDDAK
jgi:hypothetical protein